jgi:phosphohistidine phosphatase
MTRSHQPTPRRIVVVRHAKSSWDDPSLADHDRPLSPRGRKALPRLRDHIAELGLRPDLVLCSTSRRTRETLDGIREALGKKTRIEFEPAVYDAGTGDLLAMLRGLDDQIATVFLIGHNPGSADLVDLLAADSSIGGAAAAVEKFPTAAMAVLSVSGPWNALQAGCASLDDFWVPRQP